MSITLREPRKLDRELPPDFHVDFYGVSTEEPATALFSWGGEAKVAADVDETKTGEVGLIFTRPEHWGDDARPVDDQLLEFEWAEQCMLDRYTADETISVIDISSAKGAAAAAGLELGFPTEAWRRSVIVDYYSGRKWTETPFGWRDMVDDGARISLRFERLQPLRVIQGLGEVSAPTAQL